MTSAEPGLDERIFGGRWAVAERSPKPAWVQIEEQLADRIESGAWPPGSGCRPSATSREALSVSRMTVRQALASLAARGLVERGVGRGTFVRETGKVVHDLTRVAGFTADGRAPGARGRRADPRGDRGAGARPGRAGARARRPARRSCGCSACGSAASGR